MTDSQTLPMPAPRQWIALAVFLVLCLAAGWIGSLATMPAIPTWYAGLEKPSFNPPPAVFGPVWTLLYILMAIAGWRVWRIRGVDSTLVPFFVQLALNLAWSFAFFGAQSPILGLVVIVLLWLAIVWTIVVFRRVDSLAAGLLVPYLVWVSFATILNASIWALN